MTQTSPWAKQRLAADHLGVSESTLHRWRSAGLLKPGVHFRRKFPNPNSPLLYHLERCDEAMSQACARPPHRMERAPDASRAVQRHR
jgi:predicted site-specific integrase-resolvase